MKINELITEAKPKAPKQPTFTVVKNFETWNDRGGANYFETEIDGKHVGYLENEDGGVIGMWYNKAGIGTLSPDFPTFFDQMKSQAKVKMYPGDDVIVYSETDPNWPYQ